MRKAQADSAKLREPMSHTQHDSTELPGNLALWIGVVGPPLLLLLTLEVDYALVELACSSDAPWILHVVPAVMLALAAGAGVLAWRNWHRTDAREPSDAAGPESRSRFLGLLGVLSAAFFALIIIAFWIPTTILGPCMQK